MQHAFVGNKLVGYGFRLQWIEPCHNHPAIADPDIGLVLCLLINIGNAILHQLLAIHRSPVLQHIKTLRRDILLIIVVNVAQCPLVIFGYVISLWRLHQNGVNGALFKTGATCQFPELVFGQHMATK